MQSVVWIIVLCRRKSNKVRSISIDEEDVTATDISFHIDVLDEHIIGFRGHINHQKLHQRRMGVGECKLRHDLQFLHIRRRRLKNEEFYPVTE